MNANGIRVTTVDKQKRSGSAYDLEYVWKAGDESGLYDRLGGEETDSVGDILQKAYDAVTKDEAAGSETLTMEEYALAGKIGLSVVADYLQAGAKVITTHSVEKIDDQHHRETVAKVEQLKTETEAQRDQIRNQQAQIEQLNGEIETLRSTVSKEISRYSELSRQFKELKQNGAPVTELNQAKADMKAAMDAQVKAQEEVRKAEQKAAQQQQTIKDLRAQLKKTERAYDHAMDQLEDVGQRRTENVQALEAKLREQYRMEYKDILGEPFDWLYVDFETLAIYAEENGFTTELIEEGDHYDYLAKLTIN
jgi:chromosome segregation ATPase